MSLINKKGFTLIELMIGMVIFALIMITVLDSVANITIARTRSMNRIALLEELYFFSESLTTRIKDGGTLDYEEYWNRQVVGTGISMGHYTASTGYGNYGENGIIGPTANYGSGFFLCRSGVSPIRVGTGGCLTPSINDRNIDQSGKLQRYGEYALQYMDYNGNADADGSIPGDEDGDGNIIGDEDDKDIGDGPEVLSGSTPELYLYDPILKERTFFRWTYKADPNDTSGGCAPSTGSGCLGNIEILKLKGYDIGLSHSGVTTDKSAFDGNIDTWVCHQDWPCSGGPVIVGYGKIPNDANDGWMPLFPDTINVKKVSFQIFPRKDPWRSWSAQDDLATSGFVSPFIQPYVRLKLTLGLSWSRRKLIRNDDPTISVSTSVSLGSSDLSK